MAGHGWINIAARCFASAICFFGVLPAEGFVPRPARAIALPFNLAILHVEVLQTWSTPIVREVAVGCVVANQGPSSSRGTASLVISRTSEEGAKTLSKTQIPSPLAAGEQFETHTATASWATSAVVYRCEVTFEGVRGFGDADPSDDFAEATYPRL